MEAGALGEVGEDGIGRGQAQRANVINVNAGDCQGVGVDRAVAAKLLVLNDKLIVGLLPAALTIFRPRRSIVSMRVYCSKLSRVSTTSMIESTKPSMPMTREHS